MLRKEPVVERNEELLERIRKGCVYFREKLESHVGGILCEGGKIDVDKKEIRKSIAASITRLREEMEKKSHCFQVCGSGFSVKTYLEARAKVAIEKPSVKESVTKPETFDFSDVDQELHMLLKSGEGKRPVLWTSQVHDFKQQDNCRHKHIVTILDERAQGCYRDRKQEA